MSFSTISVIGLGYIGLPTAAAFASRQKRVVGVDVNQTCRGDHLTVERFISWSQIWRAW